MARTLPPDLARRLLVRAQRLGGPERERGGSVVDAVRVVGGLQAQDAPAAALGVRARLAGATNSAVDRARFEERSLARVWCMRGTLHLVPAEDARWIVAALGHVGLARGRRRREQMGVTAEAAAAVPAVLRDGPLTRHEIAERVRARGIALTDDPQAPVHLVGAAALQGEVIEAAWRGREPTYALIDDWLAPAGAMPDPDAALAELARRHAHAHPPAAPEDFAVWSGLRMGDARRAFAAIARELEEVEMVGRRAWVPRGLEPTPPTVRLLPAFDGILLGHRDRALTVRPPHLDEIRGGGILRPTLVVDGLVEGTWRLERGTPAVTAFDPPGPEVSEEVADVVRFRST